MTDIQSQFKVLIRSLFQLIPTKEELAEILKNPIQLKIIRHTLSAGCIIIGFIFISCYLAGVSRTHSFNPFHAFAFRYAPFYWLGFGVTYLVYRISRYTLKDVADGDKLTPNGEKGNSEWMEQDEETFNSYDLALTDELNSEWFGEKNHDEEVIETVVEPTTTTHYSYSEQLKLRSQKLSKMKYIEYLKKESEER